MRCSTCLWGGDHLKVACFTLKSLIQMLPNAKMQISNLTTDYLILITFDYALGSLFTVLVLKSWSGKPRNCAERALPREMQCLWGSIAENRLCSEESKVPSATPPNCTTHQTTSSPKSHLFHWSSIKPGTCTPACRHSKRNGYIRTLQTDSEK